MAVPLFPLFPPPNCVWMWCRGRCAGAVGWSSRQYTHRFKRAPHSAERFRRALVTHVRAGIGYLFAKTTALIFAEDVPLPVCSKNLRVPCSSDERSPLAYSLHALLCRRTPPSPSTSSQAHTRLVVASVYPSLHSDHAVFRAGMTWSHSTLSLCYRCVSPMAGLDV